MPDAWGIGGVGDGLCRRRFATFGAKICKRADESIWLRGGGNVFTHEEVASIVIEGGIAGYAKVVGDLLTATFAPSGDEGEPGDAADPQ